MNIDKINKFLKMKSSLNVSGLEKEAGIKGRALSIALSEKKDLSEKNWHKLLPVLNGYGFGNLPNKAKIISIVNNKGGVGKTTTTAVLGEAMARRGLKVLMVDMDSQGNLSQIFEVSTEHGQVADSMLDIDLLLNQVKVNENLYIVPSDLKLQKIESELLTAISNQHRLSAALNITLIENYDFVLIDCPPSLGLLTQNAINASHSCLVTVQPESSAVVGLDTIFKVINDIGKYSGRNVAVEGILFTMVEKNIVHEGFKKFVRTTYANVKVFNTEIKKNVDVSKAQAMKEQLFNFKSKSVVAIAYDELIDEILN
jgi:chromosome partitioning protein